MTKQGMDWDDILDADEYILWQGRPDPSMSLSEIGPTTGLFGLFLLFSTVLWASATDEKWPMVVVHLPLAALLLYFGVLQKPRQYRRTWYTLSNKRAYIATDLPFQGKRLKSYIITPNSPVALEGNAPHTVTFAFHTLPDPVPRRLRAGAKNPAPAPRIGFERLPDGPKVFHLLRDIQEGQYP